jgi:hypothetical protein
VIDAGDAFDLDARSAGHDRESMARPIRNGDGGFDREPARAQVAGDQGSIEAGFDDLSA